MIALIAMFLDHLGVFIFPNNIYLRSIGRLSFPIFAWAIANGSIYTRNIYKYLGRIFILAVISQIPYQLLFGYFGMSDPGLNILFTFSISLVGIIIFKKTNNKFVRIFSVIVLSLAAYFTNSDYGAFGVLSILIFYIYHPSRKAMGISPWMGAKSLSLRSDFSPDEARGEDTPSVSSREIHYKNTLKFSLSYLIIFFIFYISPILLNNLLGDTFEISYLNFIEIFSLVSLIFIAGYNGNVGYKMKYFFYLFYPMHLALLYLLRISIP